MIKPKYQNIYNKFIEYYKNIHINPWHEVNEKQLNNIYNHLISTMNIDNEYTFKYFMDYIIKRLSGKEDAHTKFDLVSLIPMNFRIFANDILINYPDDLKNSKLISINGIKINKIINELEEVITYGTLGKRKYEIEKALFNRYVLFGLPSLRNSNELAFEIARPSGEIVIKRFLKEKEYFEEMFNYDEFRYGKNASYKFIDNCLIYNHSSVQMQFKEKIENAIANLRKEDLTNIDTIIIDIRGNTGGNAALNNILMNFLKEHSDKKLLCLTDYRVFSGGRYALRDLINLGATTIGEEISTPINCYGNSKWIEIDKYYFSISECYFHPFFDWSVYSKEQFNKEATSKLLLPYIFKPDIFVQTKKEDYLQIIHYGILKITRRRNEFCFKDIFKFKSLSYLLVFCLAITIMSLPRRI